jgi:putative sigma-54 modulation protein
MNLTTTARHFEMTPSLRDYAEKKILRLKRFFDSILNVHITFEVEKHRHICEVRLHLEGADFLAKEESEDMYSSIDLVYEKLEKQVKKHKQKVKSHKVQKPLAGPLEASPQIRYSNLGGSPGGLQVVSSESRNVDRLSLDEAITMMEREGQSFYLFNNLDNGHMNIVYRREDGEYGLIEPVEF